jgi:hypothetical protein
MADNDKGTIHSSTEHGTVASHPDVELQPFRVAPTVTNLFNVLSVDLKAVACLSLHDILFPFGSSFVNPAAAAVLHELPGLREKHKSKSGELPPLSVFGHADPVGSDDLNKFLSGRRARVVYGALIGDPGVWEEIYTHPYYDDKWAGPQAIVMFETLGYKVDESDGLRAKTQSNSYYVNEKSAAVAAFQRDKGLEPLGYLNASTRKPLFEAYMEKLCGFRLEKTDFLGRGADPDGVADIQGCADFNPLLLLSKHDNDTMPHEKRNQENQANRRVVVFLFCPGRKISTKLWPCPNWRGNAAACKHRFFADSQARRTPDATERREFAKTYDTFACRFYDRVARFSPCEAPVPPLTLGAIGGRVVDEDDPNDATNGVPGAAITLDDQAGTTITSGAKGEFEFTSLKAGSHSIKASGMKEYEDGAASAVVEPQLTAAVTIKVKSATYHLHVDADRDGNPDDDRTGLDKWEWGKGKKGAIMLCNSDDDGGRHKADHTDDLVNAGNDLDELAPLVIRKTGTKDPPATWEAFLEVSDKNRVRIFDRRATGAKEIAGPAKGDSFKFPDLKFTEKEFGVEALQYADDSFSGECTITFRLKKGGVDRIVEKATFRVAPWIMPNHLDTAEKVFVCESAEIPTPSGIATNATFRTGLDTFVKAAGCTLTTHKSDFDVWMQDCMEFGYSNLPKQGFRSVTRAQRPRPLKTFPKSLLAPDLGYHEHGGAASMIPARSPGSKESTFNSNGNLECTPPGKSKAGKNYPFGRIYYGPGRAGEEMDDKVQEFLAKQILQEPIEINTNWLAVGHVDEFISFVAAPGAKGFKLLLSSPKRAYEILKATQAAHGSDKMLVGRKFPHWVGTTLSWRAAEVTIDKFLTAGIPSLTLAAADVKSFNDDMQSKIDAERKKFEDEIGVEAGDIIEVPILYMPNADFPDTADAMTGGMVNMLVVNKHCLVPRPFGPEVGGKDLFQEDLSGNLAPLGLTVEFIDDWYEYHVQLGEVHCGTNTLRTPVVGKWWEFEP